MQNAQKFFASFFQKRSPSFWCPTSPDDTELCVGLVTSGVAFLDNDKYVVFPTDQKTQAYALFDVINATTGVVFHRQSITGQFERLAHPNERAYDIAVSPDQSTVAVSTQSDRSVYILDTANWAIRWVYRAPVHTGVSAMAFSPDGAHFAMGFWNGSVVIATIGNSVSTHMMPGFGGAPGVSLSVGCIAFRPDSNQILIGSGIGNYMNPEAAEESAELRILDIESGEVVVKKATSSSLIRAAAWTQGGRHVWFVDGTPRLFRWRAGHRDSQLDSFALPGRTMSLAVANDGIRMAVTVGHSVRVFDIANR